MVQDMKCIKCGAENEQNSKFCFRCGASMTGQTMQNGAQKMNGTVNGQIPPYTNTGIGNMYYHRPIGQVIPDYNPNFDYRPLGMWSYFGYEILFAIPLIGFIFLLIYSLGGTRNINLRNYAQSKFCVVVIIAVLFFMMAITAGSFMYM